MMKPKSREYAFLKSPVLGLWKYITIAFDYIVAVGQFSGPRSHRGPIPQGDIIITKYNKNFGLHVRLLAYAVSVM